MIFEVVSTSSFFIPGRQAGLIIILKSILPAVKLNFE